MGYKSDFYKVDVRKEIAREFTRSDGTIDDMMAGLHEIRARMAEQILPPDSAATKKIKVISPRKTAEEIG